MCTAISCSQNHHWFGRNLDMECSFGEEIIITPRNYRIDFRSKSSSFRHHAIIGTGIVKGDYPLYYDAANEHGLAMAALRYADAKYANPTSDKDNIASYEVILWVLSQCKNVDEAKKLLKKANVTTAAFAKDMPPSPLHWIISDKKA
ncbi:MAG: linear amide C-N hydrolase, partial [Clostridia bacterium]|nr:linear amide C-N hydrolase [Clostridia bacterium]